MPKWAGRRVRALVDLTLATKGTTCHLCGLPGADSADHDPPRVQLVAAGVPDPDDLAYLWPAHRRPCNVTRQDRALTDDLRALLRARRLAYIGTPQVLSTISPRFAHLFDATPSGKPRAPLPFYRNESLQNRRNLNGNEADHAEP